MVPEEDYDVVEAKITYTTKEIIARIDKRFEHLEGIAESAATSLQVEILANRVNVLETDASGTKAVAKALLASGKDRWSKNEKVAGLVLALLVGIPNIVSIVQLIQGA